MAKVVYKSKCCNADVRIEGIDTIPKGYLFYGDPFIGMKVKAGFRIKKPTHTILDLYWIPLKK